MRSSFALAALAPFLTLATAVAAEPQPLTTRISAVTVYADRAQVTRTASIDLPGATTRYAITKLPGWIDQESVRATLTPSSAGKILDVAIEKSFLVQSSEEAVRKAAAAVREIEDQLRALNDEQQVLNAEIAQLEAIRAFSLDKLPRDMATREVKVKTFGETIDFVSASLRNDRKLLRESQNKERDLQPELAARQQALNELQARAQLEQCTAYIELSGDGRATLTLSYLTPGATWEPLGELRASGGGKTVALTQFASVVQTTGEDWEGAQLAFATQRPDETLAVPQVQALLLGAGGSGLNEVMQRMGESFTKAKSTYWTRNDILGRGSNEWKMNLDNQMVVQERAEQIFAQLAQRGTTAHFAALSQRTVRADGKAVRVPIATSDFSAKVLVVAAPEVSLNAVRTAQIKNGDAQPILPGKVALFVDGAFIGQSEFGFVAPGETFSTFLGVHDRIKLARVIDRKRSTIERKGKTTKVTVSFLVSAENLSDEPAELELGDRVPVSQTEEIEIDDVKIPDGAKRDRDGIIKWTASLAGKKTLQWRVEYKLEYPTDLVTRMKNRKNDAPAPAPQQRLYDEIEQLENML